MSVLDATFKLIVMLLVRGTTFSPNMVKLLASDGMATAIERKTKGGYADLPFKESQKSLFLTFLVKHDDPISFCTVLYRQNDVEFGSPFSLTRDTFTYL